MDDSSMQDVPIQNACDVSTSADREQLNMVILYLFEIISWKQFSYLFCQNGVNFAESDQLQYYTEFQIIEKNM